MRSRRTGLLCVLLVVVAALAIPGLGQPTLDPEQTGQNEAVTTGGEIPFGLVIVGETSWVTYEVENDKPYEMHVRIVAAPNPPFCLRAQVNLPCERPGNPMVGSPAQPSSGWRCVVGFAPTQSREYTASLVVEIEWRLQGITLSSASRTVVLRGVGLPGQQEDETRYKAQAQEDVQPPPDTGQPVASPETLASLETRLDRLSTRIAALEALVDRLCRLLEGAAPTPVATPGETPSIEGVWNSHFGLLYQVTQHGTAFAWYIASIHEWGTGTIDGVHLTVSWQGDNGSGSDTGRLVLDSSGLVTAIEMANGNRLYR